MFSEDWVTLTAQVGFPIVVSGFLLLRIDATLRQLTKVITALCVKNGVDINGERE